MNLISLSECIFFRIAVLVPTSRGSFIFSANSRALVSVNNFLVVRTKLFLDALLLELETNT